MILRRLKDVEVIDVGKAFGFPEKMMMIQWIISNKIGDEKYHHTYAVRKYTLQPGLPIEDIPFHNHKYVQSPHILSGRLICESGDGARIEVEPGDTVFFYENEPHRVAVSGDKPVELLCIIDCPGSGEDCVPNQPKHVKLK
ncbi:MAG TPA: cupin domain-containing protein [Desulfatiglandales bacterium]|nr:cupin domain-containing protein [Desulfatiglandales bacterium]